MQATMVHVLLVVLSLPEDDRMPAYSDDGALKFPSIAMGFLVIFDASKIKIRCFPFLGVS